MVKLTQSCLLLIVGISLICGCGSNREPVQSAGTAGKADNPGAFGKPEKPKFKIPVTVQPVHRGRMYAYLQAVGTIVPIKEIEIKPEMTGRIYFTQRWLEGDEVKKGNVLARMDDRELTLNINEAELQLRLAEESVRPASASLMQAYKDEEFRKAMYARGAISKYEYDQAILRRIQQENQYQNTLRNIESRRMTLQKMKQELEKVPILAPFDGVLLPAKQSVSTSQKQGGETDLTLLNGQTVGSGTVLFRLANIDQVHAALDVPAKDLEEVKIGQNVEVEIYSRVGTLYKGTVAEISTALNANTRTYTVNVLLDNPNHELRPGMFAKARIITDERLDAISIPRELVLLRNNRQVVYVVKEKTLEETPGATNELPIAPEPDNRAKQLVMAGGMERLAMASDLLPEATEAGRPSLSPRESATWQDIPFIAEERVITLGIENREQVEIVDGLQAGDLLVVLGYETLTNGVDVNVTLREEMDVERLTEPVE
ncbi:MAG TPA: efflux RND transporter periplasmic adaptor subunit [bacterium]|nr:efflux RND transporter periplasmic adaptor subunit [Candidatus Omnitrophota bacterium]HOL95438.1 efflux RND transporter periplasmic adaptor subunit [bacterium]HPP01121.1 efflux RND transporter periplasmic adaptor subunit [bacterium]HXK93560.1 efflux RND transporter periplasmic adaptor subunit [bacterium]